MKVSDLYRIVEKRSSELWMEILSNEDIDAISDIEAVKREIKRTERIITMMRIIGDYTTPKILPLKNGMQLKTDGSKILIVSPVETKDICDVIEFMERYKERLAEQLEDLDRRLPCDVVCEIMNTLNLSKEELSKMSS